MPTECNPGLFDFGSVEGRRVVAAFDGARRRSTDRNPDTGVTEGDASDIAAFLYTVR